MIEGPRAILSEEAASGEGEGSRPAGSPVPKLQINGKEVDPETASSALSLYNALRDPDTSTELVENLARRMGLLDKKGELKPEVTEQKLQGRIHKAFRSKLGADYEKFADIVGPLLDSTIEEMFAEKLGEVENKGRSTSWASSVDNFADSHELTPDIERKMRELMEDAPPNIRGATFKADKYLSRMYNSAVDELGIEKPRTKSRRRNEDEDDAPEFVVREKPKNIGISDAVEAALKGIRFK